MQANPPPNRAGWDERGETVGKENANRDVKWEDAEWEHTKPVLAHFGYTPDGYPINKFGTLKMRGVWTNETSVPNLGDFADLLLCWSAGKQIRIALDYDPDYPKMLVQVFED